ncbi:MAG: peptide ABC transporter substrate-binding protein [Ruminococcus sp.]|nr:peptide ABC transporter substrate-binding protein [Ruminococcus sp.]
MKRFGKKLSLMIAAAFAMMLLPGCGADSAERAKELNMRISTPPTTIDAQLVADTMSSTVVRFFTSTLYEYNLNRELVPALAESSEVSDDGLTVTYHLREGLQWSNGSPITADDFVYSFERLVDPATKSGAVYLVTDCCLIANAVKISKGELPVSELGVSAPDKLTFVIDLEKPCPYINSLISVCTFAPCSREFVNSCGSSYATSPETVISCGPYVLDRYEPLASQIHLSPNEKYYDRSDDITRTGVNLQVIGDAQQAIMCYETGMLDILGVSGELADLAEGDDHLMKFSTAQIYRIDINHNSNRFTQNLNIRRAIAKSIDRESIATNVIRSGYTALERVIPKYFYTDANGIDFAADQQLYAEQMGYDPEKAAEYWQEGLKELGESSASLDFVYSASQAKIAEPIARQLETNLSGLELKLIPLPDKEWLRRVSVGDKYDIIMDSWVPDYIDPTALFTTCLGSGDDNMYAGSEFRELYDKSLSASGAERDKILDQAEKQLMDDVALIPLFSGERQYIVGDGVSGLQVTPTGVEMIITGLKKEVG